MTTRTRLSIQQQVANGCRWLDENFPGWEGRIDLETLDLKSGDSCICGQVFAKKAASVSNCPSGYTYAEDNLFSEANSWITAIVEMEPIRRPVLLKDSEVRQDAYKRAIKVSKALGFAPYYYQDWNILQAEWVRALKKRQKAKVYA